MEENPRPVDLFQEHKVFFVGSNQDSTVLVAIHPHYDESQRVLRWWDTVTDRTRIVKQISIEAAGVLQVQDDQDRSYTFVPMSLELYNNMVRGKLSGKRTFASEEEMVQAFEETLI